MRGVKSANWKGGKTKRLCETCGKEFRIDPGEAKKEGIRKYCSRKCFAIWYGRNMKGERSSNWKGGITDIRRRVRSSLKYKNWRQEVFLRDNFACQRCGQHGGNLEAHHKKRFSKLMQEARNYMPLLDPYTACLLYSPMWDISNGQTLCEACHKKTKSYLRKT
jgi:5-methylcytosine-specific restriction endonuclease McrA